VAEILYLHGFASGPQSKKGLAFDAHFTRLGHAVRRLDLRVPSFEHLRLSMMIDTVRAALTERAIVIGSSLGGLTAARVAEREPRVAALVLLAPAFRIADRWRAQPEFAAWQRTGWRGVHDYTTGSLSRVDFGLFEDLERVDVGWPAVAVPTLILHGTRDEVVPVADSRAFAATRPHVQLIELDDGHELVASIPRLLAESERFVADVRS
jgi:pimeloyl-ACP methyl ester carboxylesterase